MFFRFLFFLAFLASAPWSQELPACYTSSHHVTTCIRDNCFSNGNGGCWDGCKQHMTNEYCYQACPPDLACQADCEYVHCGIGSPPSSSSGVDDSADSPKGVLSYTIIAACFVFSFLIGFSAGSRL